MQVAGKAYTQERNEMITLSLDEFGDFEGIKGDNNPIGIAGKEASRNVLQNVYCFCQKAKW